MIEIYQIIPPRAREIHINELIILNSPPNHPNLNKKKALPPSVYNPVDNYPYPGQLTVHKPLGYTYTLYPVDNPPLFKDIFSLFIHYPQCYPQHGDNSKRYAPNPQGYPQVHRGKSS